MSVAVKVVYSSAAAVKAELPHCVMLHRVPCVGEHMVFEEGTRLAVAEVVLHVNATPTHPQATIYVR